MSKVNDRQVGGTHYKVPFQHWDLAARCQLGYFEGQITKYITRHTKKNGKQDVEKALHFLDKLIEVCKQPLPAWWKVWLWNKTPRPMTTGLDGTTFYHYLGANDLLDDGDEAHVIWYVCNWSKLDDLRLARGYIVDILNVYGILERAAQSGRVRMAEDAQAARGFRVDIKIDSSAAQEDLSALSGYIRQHLDPVNPDVPLETSEADVRVFETTTIDSTQRTFSDGTTKPFEVCPYCKGLNLSCPYGCRLP